MCLAFFWKYREVERLVGNEVVGNVLWDGFRVNLGGEEDICKEEKEWRKVGDRKYYYWETFVGKVIM